MVEKKNKIELEEYLEDIVTKVTSDFDVDEVILFGSYAKGVAKPESDIDVAIISTEMDLNKPNFVNVRKIKRKTNLIKPALQLFAFNPAAYYEEQFVDPDFIKEIKSTGKSVYSKQSGADYSAL